MEHLIEVSHLCKTFRVAKRDAGAGQALKHLFHREYDHIHALDDISFHIDAGEMIGYIGPNGSGKSSTIKVLSGILTPDTGTCLVNGRIPWQERKKHVRDIGVVFGQRSQLWWDVPVIDSFELLRDIYELSDAAYRNTLEELTDLLSLSDLLKTPTRQLSLGQRMRCEIAASLLHQPKILFLDEPTIGLDAVSKLAVRDFIRRQNKLHGTTGSLLSRSTTGRSRRCLIHCLFKGIALSFITISIYVRDIMTNYVKFILMCTQSRNSRIHCS